jgi:hypothetical protein
MVQTFVLKSYDELQDVYDSVTEDFEDIDYTNWLLDEILRMTDFHRAMFRGRKDPTGTKWAKLRPATVRRKGHSRILEDTGRLKRSLTDLHSHTTGDAIRDLEQTQNGVTLRFGAFVEYGPYHDVPGPYGRPARRHVGINEDHLDGMVKRLADHVVKELAK